MVKEGVQGWDYQITFDEDYIRKIREEMLPRILNYYKVSDQPAADAEIAC